MIKTVVKSGGLENAIKRFKQQSAKSGILSEYKKREHYSKPGVVRREAKKNAIKNSRKNNARNTRRNNAM